LPSPALNGEQASFEGLFKSRQGAHPLSLSFDLKKGAAALCGDEATGKAAPFFMRNREIRNFLSLSGHFSSDPPSEWLHSDREKGKGFGLD
jgi:hypothetical protein